MATMDVYRYDALHLTAMHRRAVRLIGLVSLFRPGESFPVKIALAPKHIVNVIRFTSPAVARWMYRVVLGSVK